MNAALAEFSAE